MTLLEARGFSRERPTRAIDRLRSARDRARALLTVPRLSAPRAWIAPRSARPVVDIGLWTVHVAYADRHEPVHFDRLVRHYREFATATAKRLYRRGEPLDDLVQVSYEALILALRRFDPSRGTPFLAYATPTIVGTVRRHFRESGWALRVPRTVHELAKPQQDAVELLSQDLGRRPSLAEVADLMGVSLAQIEGVEHARRARSTTSIDRLGLASGEIPLSLSTNDAGMTRVENLVALRRGLAQLDPDEVRLLTWYYFEEQTQSEIGRRLGVSQMQVSRLLARSVQRLRPFLSSDG